MATILACTLGVLAAVVVVGLLVWLMFWIADECAELNQAIDALDRVNERILANVNASRAERDALPLDI